MLTYIDECLCRKYMYEKSGSGVSLSELAFFQKPRQDSHTHPFLGCSLEFAIANYMLKSETSPV